MQAGRHQQLQTPRSLPALIQQPALHGKAGPLRLESFSLEAPSLPIQVPPGPLQQSLSTKARHLHGFLLRRLQHQGLPTTYRDQNSHVSEIHVNINLCSCRTETIQINPNTTKKSSSNAIYHLVLLNPFPCP